MPVQVKASASSAVSIADNFTTVDGGVHHKLTLDSGSWLLGEAGLYLSGKVTVAFGAVAVGDLLALADHALVDGSADGGIVVDALEAHIEQLDAELFHFRCGVGENFVLQLTTAFANGRQHAYARLGGADPVLIES
jgi:hypothetical protein